MKTTDAGWYQVVINPDEENLQALMAAAELVTDGDPAKTSKWLAAKETVSRWLHPVIHHYVPMKRWDHGSQRVISTAYVTCLWCPKTKEA